MVYLLEQLFNNLSDENKLIGGSFELPIHLSINKIYKSIYPKQKSSRDSRNDSLDELIEKLITHLSKQTDIYYALMSFLLYDIIFAVSIINKYFNDNQGVISDRLNNNLTRSMKNKIEIIIKSKLRLPQYSQYRDLYNDVLTNMSTKNVQNDYELEIK